MPGCEMSFEKCHGCHFSVEIEADKMINGEIKFAVNLTCKFTRESIEITKCIKEA